MRSILLSLQSKPFYSLIPVVFLFSYSLAYLSRSLILVFFNPSASSSLAGSNYVGKTAKQELIKSLSVYEEVITGNLLRGKAIDSNSQDRSIAGVDEVNPELTMDETETDAMIVTGTLSGHPSFARVTIRDNKGESEEFAIGEALGSFKISQIEQHYIVLRKKEFSLRVNIGEKISEAKARVLKDQKPDAIAPLNSSETIQKVLSKEDVNKKLKDPNVIYKDARFGPYLVDGKIEGYKLYQVSKSHIFYSLGARGGDIIKRVNGMPLQDTEKMLEIWNSVKNASKVTVDLDRAGRVLTYEFLIRN